MTGPGHKKMKIQGEHRGHEKKDIFASRQFKGLQGFPVEQGNVYGRGDKEGVELAKSPI